MGFSKEEPVGEDFLSDNMIQIIIDDRHPRGFHLGKGIKIVIIFLKIEGCCVDFF